MQRRFDCHSTLNRQIDGTKYNKNRLNSCTWFSLWFHIKSFDWRKKILQESYAVVHDVGRLVTFSWAKRTTECGITVKTKWFVSYHDQSVWMYANAYHVGFSFEIISWLRLSLALYKRKYPLNWVYFTYTNNDQFTNFHFHWVFQKKQYIIVIRNSVASLLLNNETCVS